MASTKKTDSTAPPATAASAAPPPPVLVFNERLGPYTCNHSTAVKSMPKGVGMDDPIQRFTVKRIIVPPGLHLIAGEDWEICHKNAGFKSKVSDATLVIVSDDEGEPWQEAWLSTPARTRLGWIAESGGVDTLTAILAIEEREDVRAAIEEQLAEVRDESAQQRQSRSSQRAHNRRSRAKRLLN